MPTPKFVARVFQSMSKTSVSVLMRWLNDCSGSVSLQNYKVWGGALSIMNQCTTPYLVVLHRRGFWRSILSGTRSETSIGKSLIKLKDHCLNFKSEDTQCKMITEYRFVEGQRMATDIRKRHTFPL